MFLIFNRFSRVLDENTVCVLMSSFASRWVNVHLSLVTTTLLSVTTLLVFLLRDVIPTAYAGAAIIYAVQVTPYTSFIWQFQRSLLYLAMLFTRGSPSQDCDAGFNPSGILCDSCLHVCCWLVLLLFVVIVGRSHVWGISPLREESTLIKCVFVLIQWAELSVLESLYSFPNLRGMFLY